MFTAFLVTCARARSWGLQFGSGHARGLTCFVKLSVIYMYVYVFVEKQSCAFVIILNPFMLS